jgi:hypothetical protein
MNQALVAARAVGIQEHQAAVAAGAFCLVVVEHVAALLMPSAALHNMFLARPACVKLPCPASSLAASALPLSTHPRFIRAH